MLLWFIAYLQRTKWEISIWHSWKQKFIFFPFQDFKALTDREGKFVSLGLQWLESLSQVSSCVSLKWPLTLDDQLLGTLLISSASIHEDYAREVQLQVYCSTRHSVSPSVQGTIHAAYEMRFLLNFVNWLKSHSVTTMPCLNKPGAQH